MAIRLAFGTAGIRAKMGPADDQLNAHAVRGIANGLCAHLLRRSASARSDGLCVAFDGRAQSDQFAREVVQVALRHGFRVRAFETPVPTPLLAFCTRQLTFAAGVMITASHNPPDENGVKIYLAGGAQIGAPDERAVAATLADYDDAQLPAAPSAADYAALGEAQIRAYLTAIAALVAQPGGPLPSFAYSALAGVGGAIARRMFAAVGATSVHEVAEQAAPRADFAGLTAPNPEHQSALAALLALAEQHGDDLAFAHDPDADRLAVVVRDHGALRALSGDEVGALLTSFLLEAHAPPPRAAIVSTLVSGSLAERVAEAHGAIYARTPTGFKWIAARGRALEREQGLALVLGYEEAIGYAFGALSDDKDGIAALYVLLALVRRLHAQGRTLVDALDDLVQQHGAFVTRQLTVPRDPADAAGDLLARLRAIDPAALLGEGATRVDYATQPEPLDLLMMRHPGGAKLCVRPSGTEPKLKLYLEAWAACDSASAEPADAARARAREALDLLEQRVRAI